MRLEVLREASESQLASLWANPVFGAEDHGCMRRSPSRATMRPRRRRTTGTRLEIVESSGLSDRGWSLVRRLALESSHPVSLAIAKSTLGGSDVTTLIASLPSPEELEEVAGEGITGIVSGQKVAVGSASFVALQAHRPAGPPDRTYVAVGGEVGWVRLTASPRPGIVQAAAALAEDRRLLLVSGDAATDRVRWRRLFGRRLYFRRSPSDKLTIVAGEREAGRRVLMVGDGLNDAGALRIADVGLAVCDDGACAVPACDGVIGGDRLVELPAILRFARQTRSVMVACFLISLAYNAIGLTFALSGALTPLASAVHAGQLPDHHRHQFRRGAMVRASPATGMSVLILLIAAGGTVAVGFLVAFLWAVDSGQYDDLSTPAVRLLRDDHASSTVNQDSKPHAHDSH